MLHSVVVPLNLLVGAHLHCGNMDSPMGSSQVCGTCVLSLEEEKKRNSVMGLLSHGTPTALLAPGTSGALWVAQVLLRPLALLQISPPRVGQTPEIRDSC